MNVDILTCTNGRPECLALCRRWVDQQTYKKVNHVIAEGGEIWDNMLDGLARCQGDAVVIFEDDDYYSPDWVEICVRELERADLFGQKRAFMYHAPTGGYADKIPTNGYSSLHSTAFRSSLKTLMADIVQDTKADNDPCLDGPLWHKFGGPKHTIDVRKVITMKALPGKAGYSPKHQANRYSKFDRDRSVLRLWAGDEAADIYTRMIREHLGK